MATTSTARTRRKKAHELPPARTDGPSPERIIAALQLLDAAVTRLDARRAQEQETAE